MEPGDAQADAKAGRLLGVGVTASGIAAVGETHSLATPIVFVSLGNEIPVCSRDAGLRAYGAKVGGRLLIVVKAGVKVS